jgi:hypothetical protein
LIFARGSEAPSAYQTAPFKYEYNREPKNPSDIFLMNRDNHPYQLGDVLYGVRGERFIYGSDNMFHIVESVTDSETNKKIAELHPDLQGPASYFIFDVSEKHNMTLRISWGYRSYAEQNAMYAQGRTTPGNIITNVRAGNSWHNFGLAIDICRLDGNGLYDINWSVIGPMGESYGFEWGGNWTDFIDRPHFQMTLGYKKSEVRKLFENGGWYR